MPIFKDNLITSQSATSVHFSDNDMIVTLNDGTYLRVALEKISWLHWLLDATPAQRADWTIEPGGFAVYWEELDDGFEIEHLLNIPDLQVQQHPVEQQARPMTTVTLNLPVDIAILRELCHCEESATKQSRCRVRDCFAKPRNDILQMI